MQFSQIVGQQPVKDQLVQMVQHNRLSHALLFLGKEGTGGLPLALAFAQYIVCERVQGKNMVAPSADLFGAPEPEEASPKSLLEPCGVCSACKKAADMVHPDIHYSYPIFPRKPGDKPKCTDFIKEWRQFVQEHPYGNSYDWLQFAKAENKQGNINVTECEDILHKLSLKSFESPYKILVMWMPEALGKEGNKLLKLIEEPPPNTLFIFVAENDALILQTILSRTQLIKLPPLHPEALRDALETNFGLQPSKAYEVALQAEGNYREAIEHVKNTAEDDWESLLRNWLNYIVKRNRVAQVKWIDDISKLGREKQKQFLKYFIHLIQQAMRAGIDERQIRQTAEGDFAVRLNKICGQPQQEAIVHELDKATYYVERNANPKQLFHALTIKLYHIIVNNCVVLIQ